MSKFFKRFYLGIVLVFLYVPILVLIIQSFNGGKSRAKWEGFSLRWYEELLHDQAILGALQVTLSVALIAMVFSTLLGTLAAIGIYSMKRRPQSVMMTLTNLPNTMPDIVTGISLMLLFIFTKVERGYFTMLLAHITFDTPYVILSVMPKLKQMNKHTYEAALAVMWSGDAQYAIDLNPDLAYAIPKEGSNVWVDCMVIPKDAKNKENAEKFINFLCRPDIAQKNCEAIWYSSPNTGAIELMGEEYTSNTVMNPSEEDIANCEYFNDIDEGFLAVYNALWQEVKNAK